MTKRTAEVTQQMNFWKPLVAESKATAKDVQGDRDLYHHLLLAQRPKRITLLSDDQTIMIVAEKNIERNNDEMIITYDQNQDATAERASRHRPHL